MMTQENFKAGIRAINDFYAAAAGLQRPGGMVINGACDIEGVAEWGGRLVAGDSVDFVLTQIRASDEWQQKHPGVVPPAPHPQPGPINPYDPTYIDAQVTRVLAQYGLLPTGPGTGPTDIAYWRSVILKSAVGWEPYWEDKIINGLREGGLIT